MFNQSHQQNVRSSHYPFIVELLFCERAGVVVGGGQALEKLRQGGMDSGWKNRHFNLDGSDSLRWFAWAGRCCSSNRVLLDTIMELGKE